MAFACLIQFAVIVSCVRRRRLAADPAGCSRGKVGSWFGIVGWPDDDAIDFLDELANHRIQERYRDQWRHEVRDGAARGTCFGPAKGAGTLSAHEHGRSHDRT